MIDFLLSLPLWALAIVLNFWLIGFALASLWALRRWILPRLRIDTDASLFLGAAVMQSAMVLYGLVAALTAVSVWTRHSQVSDTVSKEATAIAILWRDLGGYPQRERDSLHRRGLADAAARASSAHGFGLAGSVSGAALRVRAGLRVTEDSSCSDTRSL
jgi:hypothetical protein